MKKLAHILSLCAVAAVLLATSGCVQNQDPRYGSGSVPRSPAIGSPDWLTWVDHRVDTRYLTGQRADPGSQEWYAIVDYQVFRRNYHNDYYPNSDQRGNDRSGYVGDRTSRPGSYACRERDNRDNRQSVDQRRRYRLGSIEWKNAVTSIIISGRVPAPPARSDPWDAPLAPTH